MHKDEQLDFFNTLNFDLSFDFNIQCITKVINVILYDFSVLPENSFPEEVHCSFKYNVLFCGDPTSQVFLCFLHFKQWCSRIEKGKVNDEENGQCMESHIFIPGNRKLSLEILSFPVSSLGRDD